MTICDLWLKGDRDEVTITGIEAAASCFAEERQPSLLLYLCSCSAFFNCIWECATDSICRKLNIHTYPQVIDTGHFWARWGPIRIELLFRDSLLDVSRGRKPVIIVKCAYDWDRPPSKMHTGICYIARALQNFASSVYRLHVYGQARKKKSVRALLSRVAKAMGEKKCNWSRSLVQLYGSKYIHVLLLQTWRSLRLHRDGLLSPPPIGSPWSSTDIYIFSQFYHLYLQLCLCSGKAGEVDGVTHWEKKKYYSLQVRTP